MWIRLISFAHHKKKDIAFAVLSTILGACALKQGYALTQVGTARTIMQENTNGTNNSYYVNTTSTQVVVGSTTPYAGQTFSVRGSMTASTATIQGNFTVGGNFTSSGTFTIAAGSTLDVSSLTVRGPINLWGNMISTGSARMGAGSAAAPPFSFNGDTNSGLWARSTGILDFSQTGTTRLELNSTNFVLGSDVFFGWSANADASAGVTSDIVLSRSSAGTLDASGGLITHATLNSQGPFTSTNTVTVTGQTSVSTFTVISNSSATFTGTVAISSATAGNSFALDISSGDARVQAIQFRDGTRQTSTGVSSGGSISTMTVTSSFTVTAAMNANQYNYKGIKTIPIYASYQMCVVGSSATTSTTFVDTDLKLTVTPNTNTSTMTICWVGTTVIGSANDDSSYTIARNSTNLGGSAGFQHGRLLTGVTGDMPVGFCYNDVPGATSAQTYSIQFKDASGNAATLGKTNESHCMTITEYGP